MLRTELRSQRDIVCTVTVVFSRRGERKKSFFSHSRFCSYVQLHINKKPHSVEDGDVALGLLECVAAKRRRVASTYSMDSTRLSLRLYLLTEFRFRNGRVGGAKPGPVLLRLYPHRFRQN